MYPIILQKFDNALVNIVQKYANRKWYNEPLADGRKLNKQNYYDIWEAAKNQKWPIADKSELECGFAIDTNWLNELALLTQVVNKKSKINYQHGRILYAYLRAYLQSLPNNYINILESGTARGFSALCMAKALSDHGFSGKIISFDVLPHNQPIFWNCIADFEGKKTRKELLRNYVELNEKYIVFHQGNTYTELHKLDMSRVHFSFLDAGHDFYHVMNEFVLINQLQKKGDIIFFDDYNEKLFPGVVKAVDHICLNFAYEKKIFYLSEERSLAMATKIE